MTTQAEAARILEEGNEKLKGLLARLTTEAMARTGVGGDWSPKDLIAHVAFWEDSALQALDAWARGAAAPIDRLLGSRGLDAVNATAVNDSRALGLDEVRKRAGETHTLLVAAIQEMSDALWDAPPTARHMVSLGDSLGRILAGPNGPLTHLDAHLDDLEAFVMQATGGERR